MLFRSAPPPPRRAGQDPDGVAGLRYSGKGDSASRLRPHAALRPGAPVQRGLFHPVRAPLLRPEFDGTRSEDAREQIVAWLEQEGNAVMLVDRLAHPLQRN